MTLVGFGAFNLDNTDFIDLGRYNIKIGRCMQWQDYGIGQFFFATSQWDIASHLFKG